MEMNNSVREKLVELIGANEQELLSNDHKLSGLLFDYCPSFRKEIRAILTALEERISEELLKSRNEPNKNILITRLTQKLLDAAPMSTEAAQWAVESWALALKIFTPEELQVQQSAGTEVIQPTSGGQDEPNNLVRRDGDRLWVTLAPGVEMEFLRVPQGEFIMGTDPIDDVYAQADEQPQKKVWLNEYWMGRYPVTCAQYAAFIQATQRGAPAGWSVKAVPSGKEKHPVVNVSWQDAADFCAWASEAMLPFTFRLPSESEWEKAARGTDGRIFPWGDKHEKLCNDKHGGAGSTSPVGKYSPGGDSPYGCADMAGNVWEWVNDWYDPDYYCDLPGSNPPGPTTGTSKVIRGGSWNNSTTRVAARGIDTPDKKYSNYGFRCAVSQQTLPAVHTAGKQAVQNGSKSRVRREGDRLWAMLVPGVEMEFVRVPQGEFLMGSDPKQDTDSDEDERPQHKVWLDEYWMGRYPVTCGQYAAFLQATMGVATHKWTLLRDNHLSLRMETFPVTYVSWQDAVHFCEWVSEVVQPLKLRLPSESEWEKAARGTDGRIFPWGNQWDSRRCSFMRDNDYNPTQVGKNSPQGDSPYGCADMSGNVDEWCADWYGAVYYKTFAIRNPAGPADGSKKVYRGGNFNHSSLNSFSSYRTANRDSANPGKSDVELGFRCVAILMP